MRFYLLPILLLIGSCSDTAPGGKEKAKEEALPKLPGKLVASEPIWLSIEDGSSPKIHAYITAEQWGRLGADFERIDFGPLNPRGVWFFLSLTGDRSDEPSEYEIPLPRNHPGLKEDELLPIRLLGIDSASKRNELGSVPYSLWERVSDRPIVIEYCRDLVKAGLNQDWLPARRPPPGWTWQGVKVRWAGSTRPQSLADTVSLQIFMSVFKGSLEVKTKDIDEWTRRRTGLGHFAGADKAFQGGQVPREVDARLDALLAVAADGTTRNVPLD